MTPMPADPDCAALFRGVLAAPSDPLPKLVLADWLDEHSKPVMAHAFRWCAARGRHPGHGFDGGPGSGRAATAWMVLARGKPLTPKVDRNRLPWGLAAHFAVPPGADGLRELRGWYGPRDRNWATPWLAFAALAAALEEIVAVVRLPRD